MKNNDFTLSAYRVLLESAESNGYKFLPFEMIGKENCQYSCLLRHDIDSDIFILSRMAEIESDMKIQATYFLMLRSTSYNLLARESVIAIKKLLSLGHSLGLHFMAEGLNEASESELEDKVLTEAGIMEKEFGQRIKAVSIHQPSKVLLEKNVFFNGMINTYNKIQMGEYKYISDTNMQWLNEHPAEIFSKHLYPRLQLLIHPIWWTENDMDITDKWRFSLTSINDTIVNHWFARERSLRGLTPEMLKNGKGKY